MTNIPTIDGKRLLKIPRKRGFEVIRIRGSHHFVRQPDGRSTVIPVHSHESVGKGLFYRILKDCELTWSAIEDDL